MEIVLIILNIIVIIISFALGKKSEQKKQIENCKNLQTKINKKKKIKTTEELKDKIKKSGFVVLFCFLVSCKSVECGINIPLESYTEEEEQQIINILGKDEFIDKLIIDYFNLREVVKEINK